MLLIGDWAPGSKQVRLKCDATTVLCNLEGPVLPRAHSFIAQPKAGPSLYSFELPDASAKFVFALANNHIMDYGLPGFESTLERLDQRGFGACGAGKDVYVARQPMVLIDNGVRVGVIACCEAQFGVARGNAAGVAEFGPWVYRAIRDLRATVDAVIVSVHAAVEDSPWPSPYIMELYRSFIYEGATVVHGHHAHVPQGYEAYGDGLIFYGMGNLSVDPDKWLDYPNGLWSLAAEIDFSTKPVGWRLLTFEIRHEPGSGTIVIEESNAAEQANNKVYLTICNQPLGDPKLLEALWQEVALRAYYQHGARQMRFSAIPRIGRLAKVRAGLSLLKNALINNIDSSFHPGKYDYLLWYHIFSCESHRQVFTTALGLLSGEIEDLRTQVTRELVDKMIPRSCGVIPA